MFKTLDEKKFNRLVKFLKRYHRWPRRYHLDSVNRKCAGCKTAQDKLISIFRSALISYTGGGIATNAKAVDTFKRKIRGLPRRSKTNPSNFLDCLCVDYPEDIFDELIAIDGVGKKKAALFL